MQERVPNPARCRERVRPWTCFRERRGRKGSNLLAKARLIDYREVPARGANVLTKYRTGGEGDDLLVRSS